MTSQMVDMFPLGALCEKYGSVLLRFAMHSVELLENQRSSLESMR